MRIRHASVLLFERQLDSKAWNPAFRWTRRQAPLLLVELDNGVRGIGEAWSSYTDVASPLQVLGREVVPWLIGNDLAGQQPAELARAAAGWPAAAAWSAADMAIRDALARAAGEPLWRMLGGRRAEAPVYASGGLYRDDGGPDALRAEARAYRARGFTAMKMKVAGIPLDQDLPRIAAVREGLGPEAGLWVDAVNQLDPDSALPFWQALQPFQVSALQSPLPPEDIDGLRRLTAAGIPVIASEAEYRPEVFATLAGTRAVHLLQYCLTLCGGFGGAARLDAVAAAHGIRSTPQCFSTAIAQAATLHFAAAHPNVVSAEYHGFHDHLQHLYLPGTAQIRDGVASAGSAPGLGVAIPEPGLQPDGSVIHCVERA